MRPHRAFTSSGPKALTSPKTVRMTANELGGDGLDDTAEIKQARLFRHAGVKDNLQQEVAKLVAQIFGCPTLDRVGDLISLFKSERRDGGEGLLDIPRAAVNGIAASAAMISMRRRMSREGCMGRAKRLANAMGGLLDGPKGAPQRRSCILARDG